MSSNKKVREKLEEQYGKGCMFKKAKIEEKIEEKKTIKTYKKFIKERRYTGKIIKFYESQMNFHHLKHKFEGGKADVENGAVVNSLAHMYMHSLPREQEEYINNELREFKRQVDNCKVVFVDDLEVPYKVEPMEICIEEKKQEYNRAKKKQEDKNLIKEWEEER